MSVCTLLANRCTHGINRLYQVMSNEFYWGLFGNIVIILGVWRGMTLFLEQKLQEYVWTSSDPLLLTEFLNQRQKGIKEV